MEHALRVRASSEVQLLFQRGELGRAAGQEGAQIDWTRLFEIAEQANAFPVIWRRLSGTNDLRIPQEIAERMKRRAMVAEFSLLTQARLLERALATLASEGIEAVLLKGAGLAVSVYGSFTNRPMGDLDVLVRPADAARARDALVSNGWVWRHDPALEAFYEDHCHLAPLFDASRSGASIEIHVDLFPKGHPFGFGAADVWRDRRPVRVGGVDSWMPSAHHQLLHAVIHFGWSHGLASGAWNTFRDVDALAGAHAIQWKEFVELARSAKAGTCAYWSLALARALGAAEVPDDALKGLAFPTTSLARGLIARHVVAGLEAPPARCPSRRVQRLLWELAIRPGASGHGAARPWSRDEQYTPSVVKGIDDGAEASGVALSWKRYLRGLVWPR